MTADAGSGKGPLLLIGGTFDPPHIGHLVLAECARAQFAAERTVFLPAGDPWRKTGTGERTVSAAAHRLVMTRLAIEDSPAFAIDEREVERAGPSYTAETLEALHSEGETDLVLVLGADALEDMPHWKRPERIRELARIAVAPRAGGATVGISKAQAVLVDMPFIGISSSGIRDRVAAGKPIRYLVPAAVEAYIREHALYRSAV